jgi:hypothetical protein
MNDWQKLGQVHVAGVNRALTVFTRWVLGLATLGAVADSEAPVPTDQAGHELRVNNLTRHAVTGFSSIVNGWGRDSETVTVSDA